MSRERLTIPNREKTINFKSMLEGEKTLVKGLKGKKGSYDAYLIPEGLEDYSYTKDGKVIKGTQYKVKLEFQKKQGR